MKREALYLSLLVIPFILLGCATPTTPVDDVKPGRRDYVWTIDTLYSPLNNLTAIWASSSHDVWTGGPGGDDPWRFFHYDGTKWSNWNIDCTTFTLYGFNSADVWMGGDDGSIWHFDGNQWTQNFAYKPPGNPYSASITDIWGTDANNIFAVGLIWYSQNDTSQRGFILHYDGKNWQEAYRADYYSQFNRVRCENGLTFVDGIKLGYTRSDSLFFYEFDGKSLTTIYANSADNIHGSIGFDDVGKDIYFIIGHDIYRYSNPLLSILRPSFVKQFAIEDQKFGGQVYGRSAKDMFIPMHDGIAHYNGTDVQYLVTFSSNFTSNRPPAIFDNDVFFCVFDFLNNVNMTAHGKLTGLTHTQ